MRKYIKVSTTEGGGQALLGWSEQIDKGEHY